MAAAAAMKVRVRQLGMLDVFAEVMAEEQGGLHLLSVPEVESLMALARHIAETGQVIAKAGTEACADRETPDDPGQAH